MGSWKIESSQGRALVAKSQHLQTHRQNVPADLCEVEQPEMHHRSQYYPNLGDIKIPKDCLQIYLETTVALPNTLVPSNKPQAIDL